VASPLALLGKLLRTASIVLCLIAIASFGVFAVNQTSTASGRQQDELSGKPKVTQTTGSSKHERGFRKTLDEVSEAATSPVDGVGSSEWGERGLRLAFALVVYGFGLGYLARVVRVRT
jgi:hypothetical protein